MHLREILITVSFRLRTPLPDPVRAQLGALAKTIAIISVLAAVHDQTSLYE
jgi:hypothetical protein